jgi:amino acid transporter
MKSFFETITNHSIETIIVILTTTTTFIFSYFYDLTLNNYEQFLAIISVVLLDGVFGIIAGTKREGFKTFKAIKVLRTTFTWILILSVLLSVEKGFTGSGWLSETIMIPFIVFQIISALKNASMAGYIKIELLNDILDKIDKHKGERKINK